MRYVNLSRLLIDLLMSMCILIFYTEAKAEITFKQLEAITSTTASLAGEFVQEKYLSNLDTSLTSTGVFNYQRDQYIEWSTLNPVKNELMITPDEIVIMHSEKKLVTIDGSDNPTIDLISKIFFSVLTANWSALSEYFQLNGEIESEPETNIKWQAELIPVEPQIAHIINKIDLKGGKHIDQIVMYERENNHTTIRFIFTEAIQEK